jgi:CMP-N-acetylneuraminic acid synthetase
MALAKQNSIEAPYTRPDYLASDTASMIDTVLYHLNWLEENGSVKAEHVVLLQPTNPIRMKGLVDQCIDAYEKGGEGSLVTVTECLQHPYETFTMQLNGKAKLFVSDLPSRRQDYPEFFFISGSIYIASKAFLEKNRKFFDDTTQCYRTSREEGIDIDDMFTFRIAESLLVQHYD